MAEEVDLELSLEVLERERFERARDDDPGVVDEPVEGETLSLKPLNDRADVICSCDV